ncbi:2,3-bisphosphoglycerate-independent phosphoglycerate mutase [Sedimentibacter sp. MB31-C6]|uniref:2,3-bisphosphoglycerate-independent phosphoglycerate mutase n=1 Tax=Sedimentibacter sp. MB31-C6 TaxID=3109366 RepID=UPI002DDDA27A|nr:2,3-bisphosphoglycerate-independent phosphoglycerate mutase [Sedimentibacter sp. MB36-C1]WSI04090.1 2,3-bisphosphoglycerate-independent phosphoglycerate mutase [Sedimentibacter sp. MB36-C1]
MDKVTALIVLDGWGIGPDYEGNAITRAKTPNFDLLIKKYPNTLLSSSGYDVGLPKGQMGNSEVGHLNIGAGRIVYQDFTRITKSIEDGEFKDNEALNSAINYVKENNSTLHVIGLLSDGGVHSHNTHLYSLMELAKNSGIEELEIHCITDGRDVGPTSSPNYIKELQKKIKEIGIGHIGTIMGRYYAMDRNRQWDRVELAYNALTKGAGEKFENPLEAIKSSFLSNVTDEFIKPLLVKKENGDLGTIKDNDAIIFFNFRPDRARQLTRAFVDDSFEHFERQKINIKFICMTQYDKTINNVEIAFKPHFVKNTLGEYLSNLGLKQLRAAETEKYAHVTYFLNGEIEEPFKNEVRVLIPSPSVPTYDLKPEMSAFELKELIMDELEKGIYQVMIINFANPDMVGHTGDIEAAIKAVETVDKCLGEIVNYIIRIDGAALITADHGNCEEMLEPTKLSKLTAHSTNKVPFIVVQNHKKFKLREGILADIAPTMLDIMGLEKPVEMTGESLISH